MTVPPPSGQPPPLTARWSIPLIGGAVVVIALIALLLWSVFRMGEGEPTRAATASAESMMIATNIPTNIDAPTAAQSPPTETPNARPTVAVLLTTTATQVMRNRTASAELWTNTPIPSPTLTFTRTPSKPPTHTPSPTTTPVISNAAWESVVNTFDDGVSMVLVPAGCFLMNHEQDNEQCFPAPFWIDQTEVTQSDFERLGGVKIYANGFAGDERPVEQIN